MTIGPIPDPLSVISKHAGSSSSVYVDTVRINFNSSGLRYAGISYSGIPMPVSRIAQSGRPLTRSPSFLASIMFLRITYVNRLLVA
jgi:hypothetical protein